MGAAYPTAASRRHSPSTMLVPAALQANVTRGGAMTATENIFLAWALFSGGVTLLAALLILLFNATKHRRIQ
jgi:hypothetical protein